MIDPLTYCLHRKSGRQGPAILMYHAIISGKKAAHWPWAISMKRFLDQIDFLVSEDYATPTVAELVAAPVKRWKDRTAVITFDDGYVDNLAACEELEKRGMKATLFMVAGSIGRPPAWPADGRPEGRLLNALELRIAHKKGIEIGSHGVNHVRLTESDNGCLKQELEDSKAILEDVLGHSVSSFAYPYGTFNERCSEAARKAGYAAACTTDTCWALFDHDPYRLRRLTVYNTDTVSSLARKLTFASNRVSLSEIVRYALRQISGK
jgi:peptidoglycan/xylan/chitin deacetylase (PgdA/CDA1 family)